MFKSDVRYLLTLLSIRLHDLHAFVTKYRRKVFTAQILNELNSIFTNVCNNLDCKLVEFDGEQDHVHLLIIYPPKIAITTLVNRLKGTSSYLIRKIKYPTIATKLWGDAQWTPSYFAASCGGAPISIIKQYIENQNTPE